MTTLMLATGCAAPPLRVTETLSDSGYGTVAVVPARFAPRTELRRAAAGPGEGAAEGVAGGVGIMLPTILPYCIVGPYCLVMAMPVAILGAALGATGADSTKRVHAAQAAIAATVAALKPAEVVAMRAFEEARIQSAFLLVYLPDAGPTAADQMADYRALAARGIDTVLELAVTDFRLAWAGKGYSVMIDARSRLVRTADGKLLEEYRTGYGSEFRDYPGWGAGQAQAMNRALQRAWDVIAEAAMAEHLLVLRTALRSLRAIAPAQRQSFAQIYAKFDSPGLYVFVPVESRRPILRWESLEAMLGHPQREVSYDLRVYRATDGYSKVPGDLVYAREGLPEPSHALETELDACGLYFWTVRARFMAGERSRTTRWSSLWESEYDYASRDSYLGPISRHNYFYRFRAPGYSGAC